MSGYMHPDKNEKIGARWEDEAEQALAAMGFAVIERSGVSDYQGWGGLLASDPTGYAVLGWYYGSCSGCDQYEDMSTEDVIAELTSNVTRHTTEQEARAAFDACKGW